MYVYAVNTPSLDKEPTIHLATQENFAWGDLGKTICGRTLAGLEFEDETPSGWLATCKTCRRVSGLLSRGTRVTSTDRCACGSDDLFSGYFDRDGFAVHNSIEQPVNAARREREGIRYTTFCNHCGQEVT